MNCSLHSLCTATSKPPCGYARGQGKHVKKRAGFALFLVVLSPLIAGCTLREDRPSIVTPIPLHWANGANARPGQGAPDLTTWWHRYHDPILNHLVETALSTNAQIDEALQRVAAARALARAERVNRLPVLTGRGSLDVTSRLAGDPAGINDSIGDPASVTGTVATPPTVGIAEGSLDASWEIDLFGRLSSQAEAAKRNETSNAADLEAIRITVIADIVRTYVELRGALRRRAVVRSDIDARRQLLNIVQDQLRVGTAGEFDVQRAAATFEASRARLPPTEFAVRASMQRLATLTGSPVADSALSSVRAQAPVADLPGATLPADVIRLRPDVRRTEEIILQRAALADVAYADLFPRLILAGSLNIQTSVIGLPVIGVPVTVTGGPGISLPVFNWGQRRAVVDARDAELKEAIATHRRTVLLAVEDVELAAIAVREGARRLQRLTGAFTAARRALTTSDSLYRGGQIGLTERLQAEADLRQAEFERADGEEAYAVAIVTLYRSLGAGPRRMPSLPAPTAAPPLAASNLAAVMSDGRP